MRRLRGERGQILEALLIGGGFILLMGGGLYVGANYLAATHSSNLPREGGPAVTVVVLENLHGYARPKDPFKARCWDQVTARYRLSYSNKTGWDMTDYARPTLSGNPSAKNVEEDTKLKRDWSAALAGRMGDAGPALQKCDASGDVVDDGGGNREDAVKEWTGSWILEKDSKDTYPDNDGPCPLPTRLSVSFQTQPAGPPIPTFTFSGATGTSANPAPMTGRGGEYHYDMEDTTDRLGYANYRVSIDLVAESGRNVLAGRIANSGVEFPCSFTFRGHR
jgi:hypothetical protein